MTSDMIFYPLIVASWDLDISPVVLVLDRTGNGRERTDGWLCIMNLWHYTGKVAP